MTRSKRHLLRIACLTVVSIWPTLGQDSNSRRQASRSENIQDRGADEILESGRPWELLGAGYQLTADSAVDNHGNVYFTDAQRNRILKIDVDGKISIWKEVSNGAHGISFGPDGRLYAGQHDRNRIVAFSSDGAESVIVEGVQGHHLTVTSRNEIYFTEPPTHRVWMADAAGNRRVVHEGINWPHGVRASADRSLLVVNDPPTKWVWAFRIQRDGSLVNGRRFYRLETSDASSGTDAGGMAFDSQGSLYVATKLGVQVCDPRGRVTAIIDAPGNNGVSNVFFAGPGLQWLYVNDWDKIYRRPVKRRGAAFRDAVKLR